MKKHEKRWQVSKVLGYWRHNTQHNDTQHNDTEHDETQHNNTQHKELICDT